MKAQDGKSPFQWILTIAITSVIVGIIIAMIFGGNTDEIVDKIKQNQDTNNTVETEKEVE